MEMGYTANPMQPISDIYGPDPISGSFHAARCRVFVEIGRLHAAVRKDMGWRWWPGLKLAQMIERWRRGD